MARAIDEHPSNVMAWKKVGRIPADKQPHVLSIARSLGLPVTAELIIFPLGVPETFSVLMSDFLPAQRRLQHDNCQGNLDTATHQ